MKLHVPFSIPIIGVNLTDTYILNNKICEYAYSQEKFKLGRKVSNKGGFQTNLLWGLDFIDELMEKVKTPLSSLFLNGLLLKNFKFNHSGIWININRNGNYNSHHTHPNSDFACVYYVKAPKNSGRIIFDHPSPVFLHTELYAKSNNFEKWNEFNCSKYLIEPEENLFLIFPSYLVHSVEENKSDKDRISLAFNINLIKA